MSSATPPAPRAAPYIPLWIVSGVLWGGVAVLLVLDSAQLGNSAALGTLGVIFTSIVVEALPFILIGAIVSGALATFVPERAFLRLAALPRGLHVPGAALAGVVLPGLRVRQRACCQAPADARDRPGRRRGRSCSQRRY